MSDSVTEENVMSISGPFFKSTNFLLLCLLLLAGTSAFAQSTFGTFVGTVQDQSGSTIAGAVITIANLDDNSVRSATSNGAGQYQLLNVPPGRYSMSVVKPGFAATKVNNVALD